LNATVQQELRVLVIAPNLGSDLGWLRDVDARLEVDDGNALARDIDGGVAALERAEVILLGYPVPRGIVERAPHLRWVQHTQAGASNLRGTDLWDSPVLLTSSRGAVSATGIAEYVMAGASYFACGLHEATRQKAAGEFSRSGYALRTLTGATMGIVGLGGIGAEVARLARAAGMRVVATRGSVTSPQRDAEGADLLLPADRVAELAAASDFVAVCVPLTPATERMIGAEVFAAMRPHAVLINIARGEVVDEDALVAALGAGRIAGAVLDVYAGELAGRPPRRELVEFPQVVLTPHISGMGDASGHEPAKRLFAENLRRYLEGQSLLNVVDRVRGY
jgi:phosphoglycerate dehydrogenase-like enzyme